jgi:hypothetical protein
MVRRGVVWIQLNGLTLPSGTSLIVNSAEYVVERPGVNGGLATLTYYIDDFWHANADYTSNMSRTIRD